MKISIIGADVEKSLEEILAAGIELQFLQRIDELTLSAWVSKKQLHTLNIIVEKRGDAVKCLEWAGFAGVIKAVIYRPVLIAGLLLLVMLSCFLPGKVLFIKITGNERVSGKQILQEAQDCGVRFWADRQSIRSEQVKNQLLDRIPQLQWAGVNTKGCTAVISVRERPEEAEPSSVVINKIVAVRDGYLLSANITRGQCLVVSGQTVVEGQDLASGYIDCGHCVRAEGAEGEFFAQTRRDFTAVMPQELRYTADDSVPRKKYSLLIGKKRINLWKDSGICDTSCGRMYEEYYFTLPGGFCLPVALCVDVYFYGEDDAFHIDIHSAEVVLSDFSQNYLKQQMISGEITENQQTVSFERGVYRLVGHYVCREMIGRPQPEEIGEIHGENN